MTLSAVSKHSGARFGVVASVMLACGCATISQPEPTGFLSDYSRLEQTDKDLLFYADKNIANYTKFIVEPVDLLFSPERDNSPFTAAELAELQRYFRDKVIEKLTEDDGYQVVEAAGPGTGRLRIGIADVDRTIGILNISLVTKVTGAGIGGAAAEAELLDSQTREQVAAAVAWGGGSRVLIAGITKLGDAKIAINRWSRDLRKALDELHKR